MSSLRNRHWTISIAACSLLTALAGAARAEAGHGPWEKVREEDGILVRRRTVEGQSLHEFQGSGMVQAPLWHVMALLNDVSARTQWMHRCVASELVEQIDALNAVYYNRTGAPWPVSDRDVVLVSDIAFDAKAAEVRIDFHSVERAKVPPLKVAVRMPFLRGHWYLWPEQGGAVTRVEYQVHANPGGSLPDWVVNMVSKQIPFHTIQGMRKYVKKTPYAGFEEKLGTIPQYQAFVSELAAAGKMGSPAKAAVVEPPKTNAPVAEPQKTNAAATP